MPENQELECGVCLGVVEAVWGEGKRKQARGRGRVCTRVWASLGLSHSLENRPMLPWDPIPGR